jgi:hypothetical protein
MNLDIRGEKYVVSEELETHIERRLRFALGRFDGRIGRVMVRISDVNGPRGGVDKRCRIEVSLIPRGVVRVEGLDRDPFALAAIVAKRAGRSVHHTLGRLRSIRMSAC